jgi:hypothetical protein
MPKAALAERILEMVTPLQRSASIVGDLLEESLNRSALWFWFSLFRIFISHLLQDLRIHWLRMIWLGFSGLLEFVIAAGILLYISSIHLPYLSYVEYLYFGVPTLIGWHVARRSHGRELASGISMISVILILRAVEILPILSMTQENFDFQFDKSTIFIRAMFSMIPICGLIILGSFICRFRMNACRRKVLSC